MIKIHDLSFRYPLSGKKALEQIQLHIKPGTLTLLTGPSGCGKTTLLRHMKRELLPAGHRQGNVTYQDTRIQDLDPYTSVSEIGFLMQDPSAQILMDTVWHELAFGMENLGKSLSYMKRTVAEVVNYFNLHPVYDKNPQELSGGEQQIVNLASIMTLRPKVLLLDEPTAMLDPVARHNFIHLLLRLKEEYAMTIVMVAHNLEDIFDAADSILYMEAGKIQYEGSPLDYANYIVTEKAPYQLMLPEKLRVMAALHKKLTTDGTKIRSAIRESRYHVLNQETHGGSTVLRIGHLYCSYGSHEVLKNLNLDVKSEEVLTICGANGSGKSTFLKCLMKERPCSGKIRTKKGMRYLPQDPTLLFVKDTLAEDLSETGEDQPEYMNQLIDAFDLGEYLDTHPYDLSGGLRQMAALAKVLLTRPEILLLDEPTKGMDRLHVKCFASMLRRLAKEGLTVLCVTHDLEFAAMVSDRIGMMFDGRLEGLDHPDTFLLDNYFYTTCCAKLTSGLEHPATLPERMVVEDE